MMTAERGHVDVVDLLIENDAQIVLEDAVTSRDL